MAKLGEYVNIKTGKLDANASSENGKYPFFTCAIEPLRIDTYSYDCECVLVAGNGDLNVKYYSGKFDAYQRTYIIESRDKSKLYVPYMYYFLDKYIETLRKLSIGGVIKYIKLGNLTDSEIPIPELSIQKKIVFNLDKVTHTIDTCNAILEKLDLLVKSRFVEMFGEPISNSMGWDCCELGDCLESIDNGKSYVCDNDCRTGDNPAILKLSAVTYGIYKPDENKAMIDEDLFDESAEVKDNDLLFTRKNTPELVENVDLTGHTTVIVGNIPSFASGANPFFKSDMADGYLEVVCVPNMLNFLLAIAVGNIPVVGYILKKHLLKSRKVRSLTLDLADNEYIQLDGEDLSGKVGRRVTIQFACQVHMLTLEE